MRDSVYGTTEVRTVRTLEDRLRAIGEQVQVSQRDPWVRALALEVVKGSPQHGDECEDTELIKVFTFVKQNIEYRQDPRDYDYFATAKRTIQLRSGDCFTLDTKVIVRSKATGFYELRTLGELESTWPAYEALSYDFSAAAWVFKPITAWQNRGVREVSESHLINGPSFRHTLDHKVWWYDGQRSRKIIERELGSAIDEERTDHRRVVVAGQIPALGRGDLSRDQAYLAGIYVAEGYGDSSDVNRVHIAQDREDIRQRIESALVGAGAEFYSSPRDRHHYYRVRPGAVRDWLRGFGSNSFNMRFLGEVLSGSLAVVETVMGAHADGDAYIPKPGSRWAEKVKAIHATSSVDVADQLRLMSMILGEPWYSQLQLHHGGAGDKPIWRHHRWLPTTRAARRQIEELPGLAYAPIRSTAPAGEAVVADITVADTHNFVLGNGMICHNCDDHTILIGGMLSQLGFLTGGKVISPNGLDWHIYPVAGIRTKATPSAIVPLDTTQPESFPGWEPGIFHRQHEMLVTFSGREPQIQRIR